MQASLLSTQWFRVATLKPHLRPQVSVARQQARGQLWYVLHNEASGRFHRVNERAYDLVAAIDAVVQADPTLRGAVWDARVVGTSRPPFDDPDLIGQGRLAEVSVTVQASARI